MRILIACTQYPYHGGAATNSYALIKALRKRKHTVCGLFFEDSSANCDPDKIGGILKSSSRIRSYNQLRKKIKNALGGKPDVILAKNYAAPIYCRSLFPNLKIIYLVSGAPIMMPLSRDNISAIRYLSKHFDKKHKYGKSLRSVEAKAITLSDAILLNSEISKKVFLKTYPKASKSCKVFNPINTSIIINNNNNKIYEKKDFKKRHIDIAFVCSSFSRSVKNAKFAKSLFRQKDIALNTKLVIGMGSEMFAGIPNIVIKKKTNNKKLMKYLDQTKLVICTSYFDASPNIINEALASGCNILVSKNCGWHAKYGKESVCNDVYSVKEWIRKISYLCNNNIYYNNLDTRRQSLDRLEKLIVNVIKS